MSPSRDPRRRRRRAVAGLAVVALGVAGCGGSTHTTSSSTTATTSTTPVTNPSTGCRFKVAESRVRSGFQGLIYETHYGSRLGIAALRGCWEKVEVPSAFGKLQQSRIELVKAPGSGSDPNRPATSVMRVELRPFGHGGPTGDVQDSLGYKANRAEVYARLGDIQTAPQDWPDPVNSTRWYGFSYYLPPGFPESDLATHWFDFTQWKGLYSGSPAVALGTKDQEFVVDGAKIDAHLEPIVTGRWLQFRIGIHFSPDPHDGWVTVAIDGRTVLPVTHGPTMNEYYDKTKHQEVVDPSYLKQGIYRSDTWKQTAVMYFGPIRIGTTAASVG